MLTYIILAVLDHRVARQASNKWDWWLERGPVTMASFIWVRFLSDFTSKSNILNVCIILITWRHCVNYLWTLFFMMKNQKPKALTTMLN